MASPARATEDDERRPANGLATRLVVRSTRIMRLTTTFASGLLIGLVPSCMVDIPPLDASGGDASAGDAGADRADVVVEDAPSEEAEAEVDVDAEEVTDVVGDEDMEAEAEAPDCAVGTDECDGDMSNGCEDLTTDARHCGECGHDCRGGSCVGGACQPVLLAVAPAAAYAILADEEFVYGTSASATGQVWKVPVGGCPNPASCAVAISTVAGDYRDIAMDEQALYVTSVVGTDGRVSRIRKDGTEECTIAAGQSSPMGVAVDDLHVYWSDKDEDAILRASKACGSTAQLLVNGTPKPSMVRVDETGLYWTSNEGNLVSWATFDGTTTAPVWSGTSMGNFMFGLALDDEWVYWREGHQMHWNGTGRVLRAPKDRSGGEEVFGGDEPGPRYMAVDASHVYWVVENGVRRAAYSSPAVAERLASADGYKSGHGIALDEYHVYFCEYSSGELHRVAK